MEISNVIIKPYHTEKSYMLRKFQENSCLAFVVNRTSTKIQIRNAFKAIYNVDPVKINVLNRKSQSFRNGTANPGRTKQFKIAYIILPKGIQIAITKDEMEEASNNSNEDAKNKKGVKEKSKVKKIDNDSKVKPEKSIKSDSIDKKVNVQNKQLRKQAKGK